MKWKTPGAKNFVSMPSKHFMKFLQLDGSGQFVHSKLLERLKEFGSNESSGSSGYSEAVERLGNLVIGFPSSALQDHYRLKNVEDEIISITELDVLPHCEFKALYAFPHTVPHSTGEKNIVPAVVFSNDTTWLFNHKKVNEGNLLLSQERVDDVLNLYRRALNRNKLYRSEKMHVRHLEENNNWNSGSRFLLELSIKLQGKEEEIHTSEYTYLPKGSEQLCHTSNFQWNPDNDKVDVYLLVSLKGLGRWVRYLIQNMEDIYNATGDENFELVIVSYGSDLNVEKELQDSSLKRWKFVPLEGNFSRAGGLQAGLDNITNENSIVMTIDMHLSIPTGFVQYIRKHVIKGKMGFAPMFFRLHPGYTEVNYNGFWEVYTYGIFGLFRSDWTAMGGFDTVKYTTKWGEEDWDVFEKAVAKGYEVFRIRYPGLFHYYHTRKGLWGNPTQSP